MGKNRLQCRRPRFDPWIGETLWRKAWQPTPVFLPGEVHGVAKSQTLLRLSKQNIYIYMHIYKIYILILSPQPHNYLFEKKITFHFMKLNFSITWKLFYETEYHHHILYVNGIIHTVKKNHNLNMLLYWCFTKFKNA